MFRPIGPIAICLLLTLANGSLLADAFPMSAFIQESTAIRSGPGEKFYETQQIQAGEKVEIYRITDDGWCGIRPLENSFSLISAEFAQPIANGILRIDREGIRTHVGSLTSNKTHVKYVTLEKGEPVKTLGLTTNGRWMKIAPPSGEFRWVHKRFLGSRKPVASVEPTVAQASFSSPSKRTDSNDTAPSDDAPIGTSVRQSPTPKPVDKNLVSDARPISTTKQQSMKTIPIEQAEQLTGETKPSTTSGNAVPENISQMETSKSSESQNAWTVAEPRTSPAENKQTPEPKSRFEEVRTNEPSGTFRKELNAINLALSAMVVQETSAWDLSRVRSRAERVVDSATNASARSEARELLDRISDFESLQHRHASVARSASSRAAQIPFSARTAAAQSQTNRREPATGQEVELASFLQSNNLANRAPARNATNHSPHQRAGNAKVHSGWLMPVVTSNTSMPKFALTDSDGQIKCFVSAGGNIRLKKHLRKHVMLSGDIGRSASLNMPHLIATRVVNR